MKGIMVTLKRGTKAPVAFVVPAANCIHSEVFKHQENPSSYLSLQTRSQKTSNNGIYKFGLMLLIHTKRKETRRYIPANSYKQL